VYAVEGLSLGSPVSFASADFREYRCHPSDQFEGFTRCDKSRKDRERRGSFTVSSAILHSGDGRAFYINRYQEPAFWGPTEVDDDIQRLSRKFGEQPRITRMPSRPGLTNGIIAQWGNVMLQSIPPESLSLLAQGKSPQLGILVDLIGDFTKSVKQGLPIYRVAGGPGFVWVASYNQNGLGTLRFFAVDAAALSPAIARSGPPVTTPRMPDSTPFANPEVAPPPVPEKTPERILRDTRRDAEMGDAGAQFKLGTMYASGEGLAKNDVQAVSWFRKAAEGGNADAQYALGLRYDNGHGVDKDGAKAVDWFQKAAGQGHQGAAKRLADAASTVQFVRSTVTRVQDELRTISSGEVRTQLEEVAARLAAARDTLPLSDLHALKSEADIAARILDEAKEFRRVSEIATGRVTAIEAELAQITSDAPIVLEIKDAIKSVKGEQMASDLRSLQEALGRLNKLYDSNRKQLQQWRFEVH
jgi:hypothetical protein